MEASKAYEKACQHLDEYVDNESFQSDSKYLKILLDIVMYSKIIRVRRNTCQVHHPDVFSVLAFSLFLYC